jgi:O-antigen/teichoic acid export membrane protein
MSKNQFLSTILWLILVNLVIKAIFIFGIDLQVQQKAGAASYGLYFTLLNLCYIFQMINDFGLNLLHNTDTARHGKIRVERYQHILRLKLILSLFYTMTVAIAGFALGYGDMWRLLIWLIINNILVSFILVFRAGISGVGQYRTEALISVLDKVLMIVICGSLLLSFADFRIEWFVWAQTASLVITAMVAFLISRSHMESSRDSSGNSPLVVVFKETLPFTIATFLMFIYTRSDSVMIEKLMPDGAYHVGVYAAGYRLLDAANMIAYLFSPLLIPMFARLMQNRGETIQLIRLSGGMMIWMTGLISLGGFWWGAPIMNLLYGGVDDQWVLTFRILILSHIPIGLMYIYSSYLTAVGQLRRQIHLFLISVIISIGLNFILIPQYGTVGAAMSALMTQGFTAAGLVLMGARQLDLGIDRKQLLIKFGYFLILAVSAWLLASRVLPWMIGLSIFLCLAIVYGFLFRLMNVGSFIDLLKRREIS